MNPKKYKNAIENMLNQIKKDETALYEKVIHHVLNETNLDLDKINEDLDKTLHIIFKIYNYGLLDKESKKDIIELIKDIHKKIKNADYQKVEFLVHTIETFLEHEANYLDYIPGAEHREYIRMSDLFASEEKSLIVNKALLKFENGKLFYDDKMIQGIKFRIGLHGISAEISGEHYSGENDIRQIYMNRFLASSTHHLFSFGKDPYCYLAEPGKLSGKSEHEIRKLLGAASADSFISVKIIVPVHFVWIRVKKGFPTKYAIEREEIRIEAPKPQKGFLVGIKGKQLRWAS